MTNLPIIYVVLAILLTSASHILQKQAAKELNRAGELKPLQSNIGFVLSGFFLGASLIVWLLVLKYFDVSVAYPLLSLNYIVVLIVSHLFYGEKMSSRHWAGIACIITGVYIVSNGNIL